MYVIVTNSFNERMENCGRNPPLIQSFQFGIRARSGKGRRSSSLLVSQAWSSADDSRCSIDRVKVASEVHSHPSCRLRECSPAVVACSRAL
jgi:hypothetical protein